MRDRTTSASALSKTLDPGLGNILFDVWLVSRATTALVDEAIRTSGLDADEFAIYSLLAPSDEITPTDLARWMSAPTTTVSSYIKRFEKRGHVKRVRNPEDGRSHRLRLTAAGRRAHQKAGELFLPILAEVSRDVGAKTDDTHERLLGLHSAIDRVADTRHA